MPQTQTPIVIKPNTSSNKKLIFGIFAGCFGLVAIFWIVFIVSILRNGGFEVENTDYICNSSGTQIGLNGKTADSYTQLNNTKVIEGYGKNNSTNVSKVGDSDLGKILSEKLWCKDLNTGNEVSDKYVISKK